jgi:oligopeptide/dipeptide ABC transporter ATP-binding protein
VPSGEQETDRLTAIPGTLPEPARRPPGCRFAPRCDLAIDACSDALPALRPLAPAHDVACIRA